MYMRPAKTQVSLCIDPLDKAIFLHTVRSAKGLNRMCCCSRTVYSTLDSPAIDGKYDQRMLLSECAGAYWPESSPVAQDVLLHPVIIWEGGGGGGYLRLARALIRLLRSADVQSQSVQADLSLRTSFIVGFAMHRLMRELFVQTLTLSTLGTIFSRRHLEIFFSFLQENIICTSCKLSPLHETSNPVFLVMKRKKKENEFNLSSAELAQKTLSRRCAMFIQCVSFTR